MPTILQNAHQLTKTDEGCYIRLDGNLDLLKLPARKSVCYKLFRVWSDGINVRKHTHPIHQRPSFISSSKLRQKVEVYTPDEFENLPE